MTNVAYSKCSTERNKKYRIVTKIIEKNGQKVVTKEAVTKEAIPHIEAMLEHYDELNKVYENSSIHVLEGKRLNDFMVEFPFVSGKNLEDLFENLLEQGEEEKVLNWIQLIADSLYKNPYITRFEMSDNFKNVFGNQIISEEKTALPISNLDSIFANFILADGELVMIDYEWVYDFLIPVDFILYRALFHSSAVQKMTKNNIERAYDIIGVRTCDKEQYFLMEQKFQQYVRDGQIDLEKVYKQIDNHCFPLRLEGDREIFNDYEIFFDGQCAYKAHTVDTSIVIKTNVLRDVCEIKFILNRFNGIYKIVKIFGIKNNLEEEIEIAESNSSLIIIDDYYFLDSPEIVVKNNNYDAIYIEYRILEKNLDCMKQLVTSLIQTNQYKNDADLYKKQAEDYKKQAEDYKEKSQEYINAYHELESQINQIHETLTWKIGEKIGKITRR